jgi:hypothetical protein
MDTTFLNFVFLSQAVETEAVIIYQTDITLFLPHIFQSLLLRYEETYSVLKSSSFSWEVFTIRTSMVHKIVTSPKPFTPLTYPNLLTAGIVTTAQLTYVYKAKTPSD